jgi:endonuclease/exonuclease/phosphatase (EEP) superfamily protein YafD
MRGPGRASLIYPAALLALIALFRLVGERWWPVCFLLYLPRAPLGLPLIFFGWRLWRRGPRWLLLGQAVALLLWAFPLMGFILPGRPRPGVGPALRVLSYNVDHAYAGPELVVAEIARFAPDVVLLQKLNANTAPVESLLRARFATVEVSGTGFLLATRFPVRSRLLPPVPEPGGGDDPRFARWTLDTPLGPVAFYDVHPTSPRLGLRRSDVRLVGEQVALRERQLRAVVALARSETVSTVIAGDTNLPGLSPLLELFAPFDDAFARLGWGLGYTYPRRPFPFLRIDRVFTSAALAASRIQRGDAAASYHHCVVVDLQRAARR